MMAKKLGDVGLLGKSGARAAEHPEDEDAKAAKAAEEEEEAKAAKAKEDEEEKEAKAAEEEEEKKEAKAQKDEEDEKEAKAVASAAKTAHLNARAITDLCVLARKPELAGEFIASGASQVKVRRELLADRADDSQIGEIAGQTSPAGSPAAAAAMWDHATKKNSRFFGHA